MAEATIDLEAMQSLVDAMNTAAADLRGARSDLVGILSGVSLDTSPPQPLETAATWVDGQVPGLRRRLALAQAIAHSNPNFHGESVKIDENDLSTLPPSEAALKGAAAAKALRDAAGNPDPTLIAEITANQNDPYYAAAFAKALSPEELATIVKDASATSPGGAGAIALGAPGFDEWNKRYRAEITALGTTLGTATRNTSPDLALPSDYAQKWVDQLTADITQDGDTLRDSNQGNALALSYLLKVGTYSTPFLDKIASDAYDYEREHDDSPVWAPKTGADYGFPADPDWDRQSPANLDVLSNIMRGLSHNPDAAQHFFTQGGDEKVEINGHDVEINSRLKYLLQDRTWSRDRLSDEGDGLGDALRAASTTFRNRLETGETSATIASQTIALLGDKTGDGAHGGHWYLLGGGSSAGWKMPTALRSDVADILASYVPDLFREYNDPANRPSDVVPPWFQTTNPQGVDGDPFGMSLNHDDLSKIVQTLGEDSANIDKISTAVLAYNQYQLNDLFAGITDPQTKVDILNGEDWPPLTNGMKVGPNVLTHLFTDAFTGDDRQEQIDKANKEALDKFIDLAGSLPVVNITNKAGSWAFDAVKGQVLDQLKKGPDATASKLWTDAANKETQALTHNFENVMLQNGFYDPDVIALLQAQGTKDGGYTAPPKDALRYDDHGTVIGFDFQSTAYNDWSAGHYDKDTHPTWGTMPGGQLSEGIKEIYVTNFGVHFS